MRAMTWAAVAAAVGLAACKVEVKDRGKLPEVDVKKHGGTEQIDVRPGTMPDVDVQTDSAHMPDVKLPHVSAPDIKAPDIKTPHVETPHLKLPEVSPGGGHVRTDTAHHR